MDAKVDEVKDRIKQNSQPSVLQGLVTGEGILEGIVKGNKFFVKIPPLANPGQEWLVTPVVSGKITRRASSTRVVVTMRMPLFGLLTVLFFYFSIGLSVFEYVSEVIYGFAHKDSIHIGEALGLMLLPFLLVSWFWLDAFTAEDILNGILFS